MIYVILLIAAYVLLGAIFAGIVASEEQEVETHEPLTVFFLWLPLVMISVVAETINSRRDKKEEKKLARSLDPKEV